MTVSSKVRSDSRRRIAASAVAMMLLASPPLLGACTGGGGSTSQHDVPPPSERAGTPAAEPGTAPPLREQPAGKVVELPGGSPWGIEVVPTTGSVAVALRSPGRLAVLDTETGTLTVDDAPGAARMLNVAGSDGPLLFAAENKGTVFEIEFPSTEVVDKLPGGRGPHEAVQAGSTTYVSDEFGGQLLAIRRGEVAKRSAKPVQPGGLTATAGKVAVVNVRTNKLLVYEQDSLELVTALPAGKGPSHVKPLGGGRVAVSDVRGNAVLTYDLTGTPRMLDRMSVPGRAFGLDTNPEQGLIYTSLSNVNKVARLRVSNNGSLSEPVTLPTVRQPNSLTVDPRDGTVYVAGGANADIQIIPADAFTE